MYGTYIYATYDDDDNGLVGVGQIVFVLHALVDTRVIYTYVVSNSRLYTHRI